MLGVRIKTSESTMGKEYTEIDERLQDWIGRQHMFFVSTAPTSPDGLINCSPKGLDCLRVTGPRQLAYVDTGGREAAKHTSFRTEGIRTGTTSEHRLFIGTCFVMSTVGLAAIIYALYTLLD